MSSAVQLLSLVRPVYAERPEEEPAGRLDELGDLVTGTVDPSPLPVARGNRTSIVAIAPSTSAPATTA